MRNSVDGANEIFAVTFVKLRASLQTMRPPMPMPTSCETTARERKVFRVPVALGETGVVNSRVSTRKKRAIERRCIQLLWVRAPKKNGACPIYERQDIFANAALWSKPLQTNYFWSLTFECDSKSVRPNPKGTNLIKTEYGIAHRYATCRVRRRNGLAR